MSKIEDMLKDTQWLKDIKAHAQKMTKAGYKPDFKVSEDQKTLSIKPAVCINGHPIYVETGVCLVNECEGSKLIVWPED